MERLSGLKGNRRISGRPWRQKSRQSLGNTNSRGEVSGRESSLSSHNHRPLEDVPQLTNVAWPGIVHEHPESCRVEIGNPAVVLLVESADQGLGDRRYVVLAMTQWRYVDVEDIEAEVQFFPQHLLFD